MKTLVLFTNISWMLMNKRTMSDWCLFFPKSGYSKLPLILSLASCLFWSFRMAWAFLLLMWSRWNNGTLAWGRRSSVTSVTWVSSCDSRSEKRTIIRCDGITEIHVTNTPGLFALSRCMYVNHKTIKTIDWATMDRYASSWLQSLCHYLSKRKTFVFLHWSYSIYTENVSAQFIGILLIKKT